MSLQASAFETRSPRKAPSWLARPLDVKLSRKAVELTTLVCVAMCAAYVFMAVKATLEGNQTYHFGDFFALWTSAHITHLGDAAVNFDLNALHARQVALGMSRYGYNPFPYPPTFLLALDPLGALPLHQAFYAFMVPSFAAYMLAMWAGRWREWWWALGAFVAPATGITLISGQTGFLSGALMVAGLRLLPVRPVLAGVMFGLLTYKPQLGVLIPVALVAMGGWRAIGSAVATFAILVVAAGFAYGFNLWGLWAHSLVEYATRFKPVVDYMPTIYANAVLLGVWSSVAWGLQLLVSIPVAVVVWRAWRQGPSPRAAALLVVGSYLATPHAFNYDLPMMTMGLVWYFADRLRSEEPLDLGELLALLLAFAMPLIMLNLRSVEMPMRFLTLNTIGVPMSFAPLGLMFCLIAWPRAPEARAALAAPGDA
jgi:hypothetical protein